MKRRNFIRVTASAVAIAAGAGYLLSDKANLVRGDIEEEKPGVSNLKEDERLILFLASLAPSGHNTQPWTVRVLAPYHWIVGNDRNRWLPAVDPTQRETILSIGAFLQNLEYAAAHFGYRCDFNLLAATNQDADIMEVKLTKDSGVESFPVDEIKLRRTVRSDFLGRPLTPADISYLTSEEKEFFHFIPPSSKEYRQINELTVEANRIQVYRDHAEQELADWIRFSSKDARLHRDGLTTAGMEITGIPGWVVRNFYSAKDVMKKSFREQTIGKAQVQVSSSGGWLLISSKDNSVMTLLDTGRRLQRVLLKIRKKNIAIHPMTQALEE
ncbi:MAG: nitroreductase, partial [Bacteroidota bacterium]